MSTEEISGDEQEINEISRKKWVSKPSSYGQRRQHFNNNRNNNYRHQQQQPQEGKQSKHWTQKPKDSKITLSQESDHYVPAQFSSDLFKKFDLAMKLKRDELKEQNTKNRQVNEITEDNFMQAFGISENHMDKAALLLERSESTKNSENLSA